jgi:hypothetical protein
MQALLLQAQLAALLQALAAVRWLVQSQAPDWRQESAMQVPGQLAPGLQALELQALALQALVPDWSALALLARLQRALLVQELLAQDWSQPDYWLQVQTRFAQVQNPQMPAAPRPSPQP